MKRFPWLLTLLFGLSSFGFAPTHAAGTTLAISPSSATVEVGKTVTVNVNVTTSAAINSASGTISYSTSVLEVSSVSTSGSIFSFWTDTPTAGSLKFGGGLPNPGHVGTGKIFSVTFKAKAAGSGTVSITSAKALANDGAGTNILSGTSGATITATAPVEGLTISSSTHPSPGQWYKERNLKLSWNKPSDVTTFSYTLSGPETKADSTSQTSASFDNLAEGSWVFSLTGKSTKGDRTASFRVQIDTTAPESFNVEAKLSSPTDPFPIFSYAVKDALSGIDHYEITIDTQATERTTDASFKASRQNPGKHRVKVVAFDKAGNSTEATTEFTIEGFPGPILLSVSRFVSVLQPVVIRGKALAEAKILLFVDGKKEAEFSVKENLTDNQRKSVDAAALKDGDTAEWSYAYKGLLLPGKHKFYAVQVKPDTSESNPSNTLESRVLWSSIEIGSISLPLALVAIVLLALLVMLVLFILWLYRHSKRAVGGWKDRLTNLRKHVDDELSEMERDLNRAGDELQGKPKTLKKQITSEVEGTIKQVDQNLANVIEIAAKEEDQPRSK